MQQGDPNPEIAKPASKGGSAYRPRPGNLIDLTIERFPYLAEFSKPLWRAPAKCAQNQPLPGGLRCNPEASLPSISAVLPGFPQPRAPWPVWRNSIAGPVRFVAMSRKQAAALWHK